MASCGLVAEKTVVAKSKTDLNQYIFLWTEPRPFERETYDYVDLRSRRSLQPETPNSFGGVSGSGLWRFSLAKVSESEIKPFDFQLAGVAFYQLPDTDDGVATVRFHGPRSIYELLLPQVRVGLGEFDRGRRGLAPSFSISEGASACRSWMRSMRLASQPNPLAGWNALFNSNN